jgi:hypothetical protein
VDAEYVIKLRLWRNTFDLMRGMEDPHEIEIAMDGVRLQAVTAGGRDDFSKMAENPGTFGADLDRRLTDPPAGQGGHAQDLGDHRPQEPRAARRLNQAVPADDGGRARHHGRSVVDRLTVEGPFQPSGPGDTPSRRKILVCNPAWGELSARLAADKVRPRTRACARRILSTLARQATASRWTRHAWRADGLLQAWSRKRLRPARAGRVRTRGIESALQFVARQPEFLFRVEPDPSQALATVASAKPGGGGSPYRLGDLALASRLSFFLWSSLPDEPLLQAAEQGKLKQPAALEQQIRRMLADPKSKTLIDNFAEQWLHLRNLKNSNPDLVAFPDFDDNLRQAMKEETELFFESIMREDRSLMDLLDADYTFVNERLARHYGIPTCTAAASAVCRSPTTRVAGCSARPASSP